MAKKRLPSSVDSAVPGALAGSVVYYPLRLTGKYLTKMEALKSCGYSDGVASRLIRQAEINQSECLLLAFRKSGALVAISPNKSGGVIVGTGPIDLLTQRPDKETADDIVKMLRREYPNDTFLIIESTAPVSSAVN